MAGHISGHYKPNLVDIYTQTIQNNPCKLTEYQCFNHL